MKTKKLNKKLALNKLTVVDLGKRDMGRLYGGDTNWTECTFCTNCQECTGNTFCQTACVTFCYKCPEITDPPECY